MRLTFDSWGFLWWLSLLPAVACVWEDVGFVGLENESLLVTEHLTLLDLLLPCSALMVAACLGGSVALMPKERMTRLHFLSPFQSG